MKRVLAAFTVCGCCAAVGFGQELQEESPIPDLGENLARGKPYTMTKPNYRYCTDPEDKTQLAVDGLKDFDLVHLRGDFHEYEPASGTGQMLRLIHDVMYGPPEKCYYKSVSDIPALFVRWHGDGMVASFPFRIGAMYREWGNLGHPMLAVGALDNLLQTGRRLKIDSSPLIETTHRRDPKGRFEWIALYNHSGRLENSFHPPIPIEYVQISLKTSHPIKHIISLTNHGRLKMSSRSSAEIKFVLPRLNVFEVVLVEYRD